MRVFSLLRNEQFDLKPFRQAKKAKKMKCYKRLINIQRHIPVSNQVYAAHRLSVIFRGAFNAPCLCTNMLWDVHQYGNRKSTKTYGFHFFEKNDLFLLWAKLLAHKYIFTAWNEEIQNIVFSKWGWKLIQRLNSRSPSTW